VIKDSLIPMIKKLLGKIPRSIGITVGVVLIAVALGPYIMMRILLAVAGLALIIYGAPKPRRGSRSSSRRRFEKHLEDILANIPAVTAKDSPLGIELWERLVKCYPEEIAGFFGDIRHEDMKALFLCLPPVTRAAVFEYLSPPLREFSFSFMSDEDRRAVRHTLGSESDFINLADYSDEEST